MTFNIDPVGATLLVALIGALWKLWSSIGARLDRQDEKNAEQHASAMARFAEYHAENREKLKELTSEKDGELKDVHTKIGDHNERIIKLRGDVDLHGYRLTTVEQAVKGG